MSNGWTNHATWQVATELQNSEHTYLYWTANAKRCPSVGLLAAHMQLELGNRREVNWLEIAESLWEDTSHEMRLVHCNQD